MCAAQLLHRICALRLTEPNRNFSRRTNSARNPYDIEPQPNFLTLSLQRFINFPRISMKHFSQQKRPSPDRYRTTTTTPPVDGKCLFSCCLWIRQASWYRTAYQDGDCLLTIITLTITSMNEDRYSFQSCTFPHRVESDPVNIPSPCLRLARWRPGPANHLAVLSQYAQEKERCWQLVKQCRGCRTSFSTKFITCTYQNYTKNERYCVTNCQFWSMYTVRYNHETREPHLIPCSLAVSV